MSYWAQERTDSSWQDGRRGREGGTSPRPRWQSPFACPPLSAPSPPGGGHDAAAVARTIRRSEGVQPGRVARIGLRVEAAGVGVVVPLLQHVHQAVWRRQRAVHERLPVDALEEGVRLDGLHAAGGGAQPHERVGLQQLREQELHVGRDAGRHVEVLRAVLLHALADAQVVVARPRKGSRAVHHPVRQHAERPPVARLGGAVAGDDLWGEVLRGTDHGEGAPLHCLGVAQVHHLHVSRQAVL
mmetsp:Transcript_30528/g.78414  ORF Transcript_30528/g.78414 Transcript_30528/m.78414 type:complete len:242 (-) Transcript_30528:1552-2277(-)